MTHHLFLSPHFDDVALSCGGMIDQLIGAGATVEVWTIFSGFPASPFSTLAPCLSYLCRKQRFCIT